jgi:hypothetical protein
MRDIKLIQSDPSPPSKKIGGPEANSDAEAFWRRASEISTVGLFVIAHSHVDANKRRLLQDTGWCVSPVRRESRRLHARATADAPWHQEGPNAASTGHARTFDLEVEQTLFIPQLQGG